MKTLGNIIHFILAGLWTGIIFFIIGAVLCVTIIGIPFGLQCFKIGKLSFFPFGKEVETDFSEHPILNILWGFFGGGWLLGISFGLAGVLLCITIIGIPFGLQQFKLAKLSFAPFAADISE